MKDFDACFASFPNVLKPFLSTTCNKKSELHSYSRHTLGRLCQILQICLSGWKWMQLPSGSLSTKPLDGIPSSVGSISLGSNRTSNRQQNVPQPRRLPSSQFIFALFLLVEPHITISPLALSPLGKSLWKYSKNLFSGFLRFHKHHSQVGILSRNDTQHGFGADMDNQYVAVLSFQY